jgi:hypothetical protein
MIIGTKTGYDVAELVGLSYHPFLDWSEKSGNFLDFLHCSSVLSRTVYLGWASIFFLIQRVFKYLNDLNLQNKKSVLIEH